jgi:hypothetical protein
LRAADYGVTAGAVQQFIERETSHRAKAEKNRSAGRPQPSKMNNFKKPCQNLDE